MVPSLRSPTRAHPGPAVLSFLGGAGTVTGSRFLVETPSATVLIDCGLFQGLKALRRRNWDPFPVDPADVDAVVLTHAHVDHVGYLPRLCRQGFDGPVWCTPATAELAAVVLPDTGHLQEEEAAFANRAGYSKHRPALPLFTEADAHAALGTLEPLAFHRRRPIAPGVELTFRPAGHILGSATVELSLSGPDRTICFSGDLGRPSHPLLVPPEPPPAADIVVVESTYGDRRHVETDADQRLAEAVNRTARRGGTVVIPAFAVDRTEVVLLHLRQLAEQGAIPDLPVFVDSPMALRALNIYRRAVNDHDADIRRDLRGHRNAFDDGNVTEVHTVAESKALAGLHHPSIIISASGMATGGRVLHHLARLLPDRRNSVILVGYQAAGTRGRSLADGCRELKLLGRYVPVRAEVVDCGAFSVHADAEELLAWLGAAPRPPETVYVVHGEPEASLALHDAIEDRLDITAVVPRNLERVRLD
jgi:metallo-beta-lactamase family protein